MKLHILYAFFALNILNAQPTIEPIPNQSGYGIALSFAFTEDANYLAVSTKFGEVYLTNLQTGEVWILNPSSGLYKLIPQTLSVESFETNCSDCTFIYWNLLGQKVDFKSAPIDVYIKQTIKDGRVVKSNKEIKK